MNNFIYPCITLKGKVAEAADFYINVFGEGQILQTNSYVIDIELSGQKFMLLNDGPTALPNTAISFMVVSDNIEETEQYWKLLSKEGKIFMPLDSYDWSSKYGWVQDKFGVSWQLFTAEQGDPTPKFSPSFMFTGAKAGKAAEAIKYYTNIFANSSVAGIWEYAEGDGDTPGLVKHAQFKINEFVAMVMDSSADHGVDFNDAVSLVVECNTQDEIDAYWGKLTAEGGHEVACGWLTDKYGISWQIVPKVLGKLISDPEHGQDVMAALMQMKKLVIADLENA